MFTSKSGTKPGCAESSFSDPEPGLDVGPVWFRNRDLSLDIWYVAVEIQIYTWVGDKLASKAGFASDVAKDDFEFRNEDWSLPAGPGGRHLGFYAFQKLPTIKIFLNRKSLV